MIIEPKTRGFVCVTAHPEGCAANVQEQIDYVRARGPLPRGPRNVLIVGASTGYGLSSRIATAFGAGAATFGVFFERPGQKGRTASPGWYNTAAFTAKAREAGLKVGNLNGDAFSDEVKAQTIAALKEDFGPIDLVIYSLAAPRRTDPRTGETFKSTLKPIGDPFVSKNLDMDKLQVEEVRVEPASDEEIEATRKVMGGEDWEQWIEALLEADLLADGALTTAYSYIGPKATWPIYRHGTIGRAKEDLDRAAKALQTRLAPRSGEAFVSINKAVVTQASSAIPVMSLYLSLLFRVMKAQEVNEGCIEQIERLLRTRLYHPDGVQRDADGRVHVDDLEMLPAVQEEVSRAWEEVTNENFRDLTDYQGYREEFLKLFGFGLSGVDYQAETDPEVEIAAQR